jgi:hypothetical protein
MAQRVVHQVTRVLAPGCVPLFLTDGLKDYATALLTHFGHWIQPQRRQDKGPMPKPRWMPLPELLYAQGVKSSRRRRIVRVKHRVVFGTRLAIEQALARCGWTINTAFVERLTSTSASAWRRSGAGSIRFAKAKRACEISWPYSRCITILSCPTPVCASRCSSLKPPMAVVQRRCGGRVHRRWRRD